MSNSQQQLRILDNSELALISGGHNNGGSEGSTENTSFWYNAGKFFAEQFNASDAIYAQYGNTNQNNIW